MKYFKFLLYRVFYLIVSSSGLIVPAGELHAQNTHAIQYNQQHFTDENGLPQNSVKSIMGDRDGFIWFTTENGLVRYDGHRFSIFNNSVLPLRSSRMGSFYPSEAIANRDSGNAFFALNEYNDFLAIQDGNAFIDRSGLDVFLSSMPFSSEYKTGKAFIFQGSPALLRQNIKAGICIIPSEKGSFFVCTSRDVACYKGLQRQYDVKFPTSDFLSFFRLGASLFQAEDNGRFKEIGADTIRTVSLTGDIIHHPAFRNGIRNFEVYWNNAKGVAFVYLQKDLYLLEKEASGNLRTQLILSGFDCQSNNIISIYYDERTAAVFLGSSNKGLFTFSPRPFTTLAPGYNDQDDVYYAQSAWTDDRILTTQGNILGLHASSVLPAMKKLAGGDKYSMLIDRKGYIWTKKGTAVNRFDKSGHTLLASWDLGGELTQLYEGRDSQLWIGSRTLGLFRMDPFAANPMPRPFMTGAPLKEIACMEMEAADSLWIGTNKGLYRLHLADGRIDTIRGLEHEYIRSLHIPRPGEVWITTYGAGFFLYSENRLTKFPIDKEGYLGTSHCIVEDNEGFLWITTNKGLFQVAKKDLLDYVRRRKGDVFYLYHARDEGFYTNEFNGGCQPCAVKLPNGYISLPSLNGLVWFSPQEMKPSLPDREIFIDRIEVNQVPVLFNDTITVPRDFRLLKVYCSTPYTGNEYNVNMQYAWIKKGETPAWLPLDDEKIISQSTLRHGRYTLIIRKANGFGIDNYSFRKLTVIVPPAYYETWWFYGLLAGLLIFLVWLYTRLRIRYIRHSHRQLERLVDVRTEELRNTLSALSTSEQNTRRQMHVREVLLTAISHDIGSPLKYITMMAEELRDGLAGEVIPDKMKKHGEDIYQSGYYLYHLTRNLLQYLRISGENTASRYERFDLYRLVENKVAIFRAIGHERSVDVINAVPEPFDLYTDPLLLEVVIHNLLDNAIKVTREGNVTVRVAVIDAQTHLIIEDTGPGMRAEIAGYYNNDAVKEEDTRPRGAYSGFGLGIVKELTRLTGVVLNIETGGTGTAVHLIFSDRQPVKE